MISLSKIFSAVTDKLGFRIIKIYQYGPKTANECAPFGDDSNPVQGWDAVYAETATDGDPIVIGYFNPLAKALPGEKRLYSVKKDATGKVYEEAFYLWIHADGTCEIGGKTDNLVRYTPLNNGLTQQNTSLNAELAKIQIAIGALGGTYVRAQVNVNVSGSKINEIKCL